MTPAERDEVRAFAEEVMRLADYISAPEFALARAVLRYVPPGDATDTGVPHEWVAAYPHKARRLAHALHTAADAAEETDR